MRKKPTIETKFLTRDGLVKKKLKDIISDVLKDYTDCVKFWHEKRNKGVSDYLLREVYIVGSVISGEDNSDLDLLIIGEKLDGEDYRFFKQVMAQLYWTNRKKSGAIDIYIRPHDEFPEKPSFEITSQLEEELKKCNDSIKSINLRYHSSEDRRQNPRTEL